MVVPDKTNCVERLFVNVPLDEIVILSITEIFENKTLPKTEPPLKDISLIPYIDGVSGELADNTDTLNWLMEEIEKFFTL